MNVQEAIDLLKELLRRIKRPPVAVIVIKRGKEVIVNVEW